MWRSARLTRGSTVHVSGSIAEVGCCKRSSALREKVVLSLAVQRVVLREVWLIDCYAVSVLLKSRACACVFVG